MQGGDLIITMLGLTGLCLGAMALILWAGVSAGLIVCHRFKGPTEDECDDLADGDMPHLAPDVLTSFHASTVPQTEEPGRVR